MKIDKIEHIGIAVKNINQAARFYSDVLGFALSEKTEVPSQKVRVAFIKIGETKLELIEPTSPDSKVAKFIEKKGEGIHHICLQVDRIDQALKELKNKRIELIDQTPRIGATGKRIAFMNPKSASGVLIELEEK